MNRRRFMRNALQASVFLIKPALAAQNPTQNDPVEFTTHGGLVIERACYRANRMPARCSLQFNLIRTTFPSLLPERWRSCSMRVTPGT